MGVEEITVPARFLTTIAHLVATLTIVYDVDNIAHDANRHSSPSEYSGEKNTLEVLTYASLACFIIEVFGMFSGVTIFVPSIASLYIFLHTLGTILLVLFLGLHWALPTFTWLFVIFSAFPAFVEICMAFIVMKLKLFEYS
mmetsp:Transcript_19957/g.43675  ORF Transcript_19957/g.43675 Transcript_19957/m.43675 type:complete len:141 (-) Transcript_19957:227-649(-)